MINDYLISKTEFWEFCIIQGLDSRKNIGTPAIVLTKYILHRVGLNTVLFIHAQNKY